MNRRDALVVALFALAMLLAGFQALWQFRTDEKQHLPSLSISALEREDRPVAKAITENDLEQPGTANQEAASALHTHKAARIVLPPTDCLIIEATAMAILPAALQARYPSAKTLEPVALPSLADHVGNRLQENKPLKYIQLPLSSGRTATIRVDHHQRINPQRGTLLGKVLEEPESNVIISYYNEATTASVIIPGQQHDEIAYAGDGCHLLLEIDPSRILPNAQPLLPPIEIAQINVP